MLKSLLSTEEDRPGYRGWRVAAASAVGVSLSFASLLVYTFGVFLKPLAEEFSWSRESVSAAFGVAAMTAALSSPLLGRLFDRFTPRRIIVPSILIFGGTFASLALLTPRLFHLYAAFFMMGLVANGTAQMAYSRAISTWFDRRRGTALAVMMSGGAVGAIVLPPAADALIRHIGWRGAFLTLGLAAIVITLPVVVAFVGDRPPAASGDTRTADGVPVRGALRSRAFWMLVVVLFVSSIAHNGAITQAAALLTDRGIAAERATLVLSALGLSGLVGRLLTGWLLDRFFAARVGALLLVAVAAGMLLLSNTQSLAGGLVAASLIGFGMGGESDVTPFMLSRYFGLRSFSTLYGLTWTAYAFAGAIGPVLMGRAYDASGSYTALLVVLAFTTGATAIVMLLMPAYPPPRAVSTMSLPSTQS